MIISDVGFGEALALFPLLAALGCCFVIATRAHRANLRWQLNLFFIAFAIRFAFSIGVYQFGLLNVLGDDDQGAWFYSGHMAAIWDRQGLSPWQLPGVLLEAYTQTAEHVGYRYLLAAYFYLTGCPHVLPGAVLNDLFGALTVLLTYRLARSLFSEWVATRVGWVTCFFPSMIVWSGLTLKEPVVIFLEALALYGCVRLQQSGFSLRHLLLCAVTIALLPPFRFYATYIVCVAVVLSLLIQGTRRLRTGLAAIALGVLLAAVLVGGGVVARHERQLESLSMDRMQDLREAYTTRSPGVAARSSVKMDYDLRTPGGAVMGTLLGGAYLLLAPFPWQLGGASMRMLLTLPELVVWWWMFFVGFIPGLIYCLRRRMRETAVMLLFGLGFGLLYSMMFANVGLVFRQRAQLMPWLVVCAIVGLEQKALRKLAALLRREHAIRPARVPAPAGR
jgi:4-amino-4-deoxy-L-arabinose transferase-like glycosyltransferase